MALSLEASTLRQQGEHARALRLDTRALELLDQTRDGKPPERALARCDALTGLAADHIGLGGFDPAASMLAQTKIFLAAATPAPFGWRARVRWVWVNAEAAIATGDQDAAAAYGLVETRSFTEAAVPSLRHRVKTSLIQSAAHYCTGNHAQARLRARHVFEGARSSGLVPLAWAAAMLLHAVDPGEAWDERASALRSRWT